VRPENYRDLPPNRHGVSAGSILLPTEKPITQGGASSRDFVEQQGGDGSTFIFIFGLREGRGPFAEVVEFVEGIFLSESGPGFHPTWDQEQLLQEIDRGGWTVITRTEMLASWVGDVEERINKGEA
jgi:hypothetical protein